MPSSDWIAASAFALLGFAATLIMILLVKRTGIVDAPDEERKTQTVAVPRLGGVAILLGTLFGILLGFLVLFVANGHSIITGYSELFAQSVHVLRGYETVFGFIAVAFLLGLWDDVWTANTKLKLAVLGLACATVAALGHHPSSVSSPFGSVSFPVFLVIGSAAWLLVFTNAVNFMDGANGIAMGSLSIMLAGLAVGGTVSGDWSLSVWWFTLFGAIAGFLLHNLSGSLYVGDAGALGLGALFAALGLKSGLDVWTVATLGLPFLIDVLLTLIWRAKHGRNWLSAHLDHAYQRLIAGGWSHIEVSVLYWGFSASCAVSAYIGARAGGAAPFAIFWALCVAGSVLWIRHRRSAH